MRFKKPALGLLLAVWLSFGVITPATAKTVLRVQMPITAAQTQVLNEKIIPQFEQANDVDVQLEVVNWNTRQDKLFVTTAAGIPPDVFMNGSEHVLELVKNNLITPLDKEINAWSDMKDFYPPSTGSSTFNGHRYGVPFYTAPRAWWYRTDLFDESGLDGKNPPTSWDGILYAARKITRVEGNKVTRQGYDLSRTFGGAHLGDFAVYLWQNGGELVDSQTFQAKFQEAAGVETLQWLYDLLQAVRAPGNVVDNGTGAGSAFLRGRVGIHLGGGWISDEVYKLDPSLAAVTKAIIPTPGKVKQMGVTFSAWLAIHANSPNKELAWEFIKTVTSATNLYELNAAAGIQSPRRSTVKAYIDRQPLVKYLYDTLNYCVEYPVYPKVSEFAKVFAEQYNKAIAGQVAPAVALGEAARKWNAIAAAETK